MPPARGGDGGRGDEGPGEDARRTAVDDQEERGLLALRVADRVGQEPLDLRPSSDFQRITSVRPSGDAGRSLVDVADLDRLGAVRGGEERLGGPVRRLVGEPDGGRGSRSRTPRRPRPPRDRSRAARRRAAGHRAASSCPGSRGRRGPRPSAAQPSSSGRWSKESASLRGVPPRRGRRRGGVVGPGRRVVAGGVGDRAAVGRVERARIPPCRSGPGGGRSPVSTSTTERSLLVQSSAPGVGTWAKTMVLPSGDQSNPGRGVGVDAELARREPASLAVARPPRRRR